MMTNHPMAYAKNIFRAHKFSANKRGLQFSLSFDEWYNWYLNHGVDKNIQVGHIDKDRLCMCRKNDKGGYSLNNIYTDSQEQNCRDYGKEIMTPKGKFKSGKKQHWHLVLQVVL